MCYCGWLQRDGIFDCCEERFPTMKTGFIEKGEKIEVASAYMPSKEGMGENMKIKNKPAEPRPQIIPGQGTGRPANETPREELLLRDVAILFKENRELKEENKRIMETNRVLIEQNIVLLKAVGNNADL